MRQQRFFHSLRFKITAGIAVPLLVILGAFAYLQHVRQRDLLLSNLDRATSNLGHVIVGSLEHAMLTQDLPEIQNMLNDIAKQQGIRDVFLINRRGEVRFSPRPAEIGKVLTQADPGCVECHKSPAAAHAYSTIFTSSAGDRVFRNCVPIQNPPECQACHDSKDSYNGVLITDLSMQSVDESLAQDLRASILWSSTAILATIVLVNALMSRLIVTRVERLVEAFKQFSRGNLERREPLTSPDEIGELADSFNRMAERVLTHTRELERLNQELRRKETLRGQLLAKLITAQEEERKRIARDLHDQLGQALSAMTMGMQAAERALPPSHDGLKERLLHAKELATQALEQTHELILDLRPVALDDLGLVAAMRAYAEQHLAPRGVEVRATVRGATRRLKPELEIALFRMVQEAINNIANHANARHVDLSLEFQDSVVQIVIQDDGCGFDAGQVLGNGAGRGFGLLGMQERATLAEGTFRVDSQPGCGTCVTVTMPIETPAVD